MYVAVKRWREGHRQRPSPAGAQAPRRYRAAGAVGGADPPADAAGRVAGDDRGFAVRRATGGTGDQAGGRRPDGSDLPSPRLPHHAAALRRQPAAGHRRDASATTDLGDLQGPAGRATARSDLRLYPSPARLQPARRGRLPRPRSGAGRIPGALSARARPARPGRPDDAGVQSCPARCRISPAEPLDFPTGRAQRLQALARGDEGFLLALGYSTQRGYGRNHPFAGEIRIGACEVWLEPEELGFAVPVGEIEATECRWSTSSSVPRGAAAIHPWLRPGLRLRRAQGDGHGPGRPRPARRGIRRGGGVAGAAGRVRPDALRQRRGRRLRLAPEAAALRRFPVRAGADSQAASSRRRRIRATH